MASSWKRKNTLPCIKVGCLRPAVTFCLSFLFSPQQTRVRFDSAIRSPVPHGDDENGRERKTLSPPSCSTSSSNEAPVKQKAEQSCGQAPPQRPLVPLVSMILQQQIKMKVKSSTNPCG